MPVVVPSAVRRGNGIPGYTPEAQRLAEQLAELGIAIPQRRRSQQHPPGHTPRPAPHVPALEPEEGEEEEEEDTTMTDDLGEEIAAYPRRVQRRRRGQAYQAHATEHLPQTKSRRQVHWLLPLGFGMLTFIGFYIVIYFVDLGLVSVSNRLSYGPHHISVYSGVIGDHDDTLHPTIFLGTLLHGSVLVEELPGGDVARAKAFTFPPLLSAAWGNSDDVVVTVTARTSGPAPTMLVNVIGDPQFGTLLARPTATFLLVHTNKGYKYGGLLQQSG